MEKDIDYWLDEYHVYLPEELNNYPDGLRGWYAVESPEQGIMAYFANESDAFRFRLSEINRRLNG